MATVLTSPLFVPVKSAVVTSPFGLRTDPIDGTPNKLHAGVDFAPRGDKLVLNAHPGVIKEVGPNRAYPARGNYIVVQGDDGREYHYWHLAALIQHKVGLRVPARLALGVIGKTGRATADHLHFEVREKQGAEWVPVDPGAALGLVALKKGAVVSQAAKFAVALVVVALIGGVLWVSA